MLRPRPSDSTMLLPTSRKQSLITVLQSLHVRSVMIRMPIVEGSTTVFESAYFTSLNDCQLTHQLSGLISPQRRRLTLAIMTTLCLP